MSIGHWLYLIGIIIVVVTMLLRRNVLIPCIIFTLLIGWSYSGSFTKGVQTVFNASLVAGQDLLSIFLIIGLMVALLKSLSVIGADEMMVVPLKKMMVSPLVSYIVLAVATFVISLFFWPTPAVPLVGALLVPVAIRAGLPPMLGAMALALAGQGMALGGDIVIQGAPGLTAAAAGVPVALVTSKAGWLSAITGIVALVLAYLFMRPEIARFQSEGEPDAELPVEPEGQKPWTESDRSKGRFLIYLLAIAMIFVIVGLFVFQLRGGDASALLGGVALSITLVAALLVRGRGGLDAIADYVADGLVFAFRVMGPIIPIAGFFFLGNPEASATILGEGAPGYLFDWGNLMAEIIPPTGFLAAFGLLILGIITGLDGSGFSGLPLVGTLAGALAGGDMNVAATLGSVGQIGAIWSGGGTLVAWCSLVAVAGIVGVPVLDLVRKNFLPVIIGMVVSTVVAVLFMM